MNDLHYIDKTGTVYFSKTKIDISTGKKHALEFYSAIEHTIYGEFVVNIIENDITNDYRMMIVVPPKSNFIMDSPQTYFLTEWEHLPSYHHARYLAHNFIRQKRELFMY